jgi:hypothetical protein
LRGRFGALSLCGLPLCRRDLPVDPRLLSARAGRLPLATLVETIETLLLALSSGSLALVR